ncbi:MAG: glycosyltransferase [Acidimicrobiales bacterium]|jgi:hypothetical protein
MSRSYHVYVSDRGNVFMTEIAAVLAAALGDLGYDTVFPAPGLPERGRDRVNLVMAPHEFFTLQRDHTEQELLQAAAASVSIGVEQPGTRWFELGTHYAGVGAAVLDISPYAVDELRSRGLDAMHLQLGYHPSWDRWGGEPTRPRPTDLLFLGSMTPRRDRILAEAAHLLWDCNADIRLFEFPRPMSEPRANFVASEAKWEMLASSRVLLNVHRDEVPYFEWVRVLEAVVNGCLVVTESSTDYGPLLPGEHLIAAPADVVSAYAASMVIDEPLRAELAGAAYDFVRTKLELKTLLQPVCTHLEEAVVPGVRRRAPAPKPMALRPAPVPAGPAPVGDATRNMISRVKDLLDGETQLLQQVEALQARLVHGSADHVDVTTTESWDDATPEVTVLVTSYNYRSHVTDAMASVRCSLGVAVELVVVDDHSEDDSVDVITQAMAETHWFPTKLVARAANAGVGVARNTGIAHARSDRVFILDADNLVYPTTLRKLSDALDREPGAAFSYGIIARIGDPGLLSHLPWDVERLTMGNYIDAMAMIRRPVWDEAGGYDVDSSLRGWEDYEFWLRLAAMGAFGAFVPEFVGCYRVHAQSRQQTVNLDTAPLMADFRARYPFLPWSE